MLLSSSGGTRGKDRTGGREQAPNRRSCHAKQIGDHAELIVVRELKRQGRRRVRHLAVRGETPGYDIEYTDHLYLVAQATSQKPRSTILKGPDGASWEG